MKKQKGFTLIEIMIALMLGLIVIGGAISIYISTIRSSTDITNSARLNYDLDSVMQLMVNDIRRAGFWGGAVAGSNSNNRDTVNCANPDLLGNPFTCGAANIQIPVASCILYTYDADGDGLLAGDTEYYGFKLQDGNIRIWTDNAVDASGDCTANGWQTITDENKVNITNLTFSFSDIAVSAGPPAMPALPQSSQCLNTTTSTPYSETCAAAATTDTDGDGTNDLVSGETAVETRQINIVMTGEASDDASVTKVLTASVKVRNDRIFTQL